MNERELLAAILPDLKDQYLHMVYVFAKSLYDAQTAVQPPQEEVREE